jgi:hypothetical protein
VTRSGKDCEESSPQAATQYGFSASEVGLAEEPRCPEPFAGHEVMTASAVNSVVGRPSRASCS